HRLVKPTIWPVSRLLSIAFLAACGGGEATMKVDCNPPCPARSHCTDNGCVSDDPATDLSAGAGDAAGCGAPCSGATPVCGTAGVCVACLVDGDCPAGTVCKVISPAISACVSGCNDDSRCGGGTMKCCTGHCFDISKDSSNCGGCGVACMTPKASASCQNGQC